MSNFFVGRLSLFRCLSLSLCLESAVSSLVKQGTVHQVAPHAMFGSFLLLSGYSRLLGMRWWGGALPKRYQNPPISSATRFGLCHRATVARDAEEQSPSADTRSALVRWHRTCFFFPGAMRNQGFQNTSQHLHAFAYESKTISSPPATIGI